MKQFVSENLNFLKDFAAENKFKSFKYSASFIILFTLGLLISPSIIELFESRMPFDKLFSQTAPESMFFLSVLLAFDFALLIISGFVFHNILISNRRKLSLNDRNSQILLHLISVGLFGAGLFFAYFVLVMAAIILLKEM